MQITNINNLSESKYKFTARQRVSNGIVPVKTEKKKDNSNKRLYYGIGIAGVLLLSLVFRKHIKNIFSKTKPDIIDGQGTRQIEPPKILPTKEEIDRIEGEKLRKKYHELVKELRELRKTESTMTSEEIKNLKAKEKLAQEYHREIARKNISIVEIKEFSTDPTQDVEAKKEYLHKLTNYYVVNEASQKDCLDMYEKYGFRYWIKEVGDDSFIRDLSLIATPNEFSDGEYLMRRFLDIAERTTERDPLGMRDGNKVMVMYEMYGHKYGEDITLRFINLMKKISFQQLDATVFDIYTQEKSTPAIKKAIEELKEITKDFPEVDRFKNT